MNKITFHFYQILRIVLVFKLYCYLLVVTNRKVYILDSILNFKKKEIKMVNWKLMGVAGLTYLASLGAYNLVNTKTGYDNLGRGLRE